METYKLGPLEQKVMECVWKMEKVCVKDVYSCLRKRRKIAYTTVMTVMTRLAKKGFLTRRLQGRAYLYSSQKSKEQTAKSIVKRFLHSLVDQYGKEAITAFTDELKKYKNK
jgi:predicted transcriptional regulator